MIIFYIKLTGIIKHIFWCIHYAWNRKIVTILLYMLDEIPKSRYFQKLVKI